MEILAAAMVVWFVNAVIDGFAAARGHTPPSVQRSQQRTKARADRLGARSGGSTGGAGGGGGGIGFFGGVRRYFGNAWQNANEEAIARQNARHQGHMQWIEESAGAVAEQILEKERLKAADKQRKLEERAASRGIPLEVVGGGRHAAGSAAGGTQVNIKPGPVPPPKPSGANGGPAGSANGTSAGGAGSGGGATPEYTTAGEKDRLLNLGNRFVSALDADKPLDSVMTQSEWISIPAAMRGQLLALAQSKGKTPCFLGPDGKPVPVADMDPRAKEIMERLTAPNPDGAGAGAGAAPAPSGAGSSGPTGSGGGGAGPGGGPYGLTGICVWRRPGEPRCGKPEVEEGLRRCADHKGFGANCLWPPAGRPGEPCGSPRTEPSRYCDEHERQLQTEREDRKRDRQPAEPAGVTSGSGRDLMCSVSGCPKPSLPNMTECSDHSGPDKCSWRDPGAKGKCTAERERGTPYCLTHLREDAAQREQQGKDEKEDGSAAATAPSTANGKGEDSVAEQQYQRWAETMRDLGGQLIAYGAALEHLADQLRADGWGKINITGQVAKVAPRLRAAGQKLIDRANQILADGSKVQNAWESNPDVPEAAEQYLR